MKKNEIEIQGDLKPRPILKFNYTNLPERLLQVFKGFEAPTPIQATTWPITLAGRDIIGIAETGSGKTYAFTLPGLVHIASKKPSHKQPSMLVVSPTRELAMQSEEQAKAAGKIFNLKTACLYGGVGKGPQAEELRRGVDIVVATPGRLLDLIEDGSCDLSKVSFLVLDEADRMLDDGFERDIRKIIDFTPKDRQTLMFSATWPESIRKLAEDFLKNPIRVAIGSTELAASQNVKQIVEVVDEPRSKERKLLALLKKIHLQSNRILVFGLYKKECDRIERTLLENGYKVVGIHGNKSQMQRTDALSKFKAGTHPVMVATDVAARGLDIPDVEYVINVTFPLTIESYVHRIGRTGRGGKKGTAYTFFTVEDKAHSGELINVLKQANMEVPEALMKFGTTVKKKTHGAYGAFFKDISDAPKATKIVFGDD
ncbi:P-loop containing nucleoside triphosphate hydrolase protein [Dichotomocladium elegans]|nr:P-loop containing nucleoside triphosphate hydrolase protein [Dichotomocladium elegans]